MILDVRDSRAFKNSAIFSCSLITMHKLLELTTKKKNQVSHDHRSYERNLSNCEQKPEKVRTPTGFEPVTSRYRCDAPTN